MLYKVVSDFKDDDGIVRKTTDAPYEKELTKKREHILTTSENKFGRPFIERVEEGGLEDLTVPELKEMADKKELDYDSKIKKEDLVKLLSE